MIVGIDLGTTNSLVAVWSEGVATLVPNSLKQSLTPSVVSMGTAGEILVGQGASERLYTHPTYTAASFKRYMGSNRQIFLGKRLFRAEELSALVLKSLKADAEAFLGERVTEAVITVPAYFSDAQRKATRAAGELAGLKVERLLNEPTAAALAYGLNQGPVERKFLVFDLGGGTFDVSILELFEGVMEVRASAGDNFLGGEDFVERLVDGFMSDVGTRSGLNLPKEGPLHARLRVLAEQAKRTLSSAEHATMTLNWEGKSFTWEISRERFERLVEPLVQRLRAPVERALRDSRLRAADLDEVLLIGGATRMPLIRKLVATMFGRLPSTHIHPDEAVALGAAVQAGLKARDVALNEVVLTDVCPYTLGTEVSRRLADGQFEGGIYLPVIERNTVIPASRVERVWTLVDFQKIVEVNVFQGESRMVRDNIHLGKLTMPVPRKKAGEESVDIRFTYDINGLLEVEATIVSTGDRKQILIEENPGVLTKEEIATRRIELAALKIHPRDQAENQAIVARGERLFEQSLGDTRDFIGQALGRFQEILARQDLQEIAEARAQLHAVLDQIQNDPFA